MLLHPHAAADEEQGSKKNCRSQRVSDGLEQANRSQNDH
jgi:hypothetical protein